MPKHNGFEIARRTRAIIPDVPVIFMTAFEINPGEFDKVFPTLDGLNGFLKKPVTIQGLLKKVRQYDDVRERKRTIT
jgi:CheY-like chemotaxis protein